MMSNKIISIRPISSYISRASFSIETSLFASVPVEKIVLLQDQDVYFLKIKNSSQNNPFIS